MKSVASIMAYFLLLLIVVEVVAVVVEPDIELYVLMGG